LDLSERVRKRLAALVADDRASGGELLDRLRELRAVEGIDACAAAVHSLAHLQMPEGQAERLLEDLVRHRDQLREALGRDAGLRVAAIDYLSNVKKLLANPTIVESNQLERTEKHAITDELTRLYNRRHFERTLSLELRRSQRYSLRLSLLMLDLDAFKGLNDRYGHLFGDLVLQRVGQILRRAVREADVPCRFGGEEFAVILPETDRLGAYAVAERVRRRIAECFAERPVGGRRVGVSLSGGIAAHPDDGEVPDALVARADQALYISKSRGKNCISLFHAERRSAVRYPVKATARIGLAGPAAMAAGAVQPVNLSRSGALLEVAELPASVGEVALELTFGGRDASGKSRCWTMPARVVRLERRVPFAACRIAVAFEEPLPEECLQQQVRRGRSVGAVEEVGRDHA
jgi:diguanylate cyclase (GGDEF)-like protein